jgi:hypothetical protein
VLLRRILGNLELGLTTLVVVAVLVGIRAVLWELGVEGLSPTAVSAGIITGGVFVVGLVVAGTLSDYRDAERAPTDIATGLYSTLREAESMHSVWKVPDLAALRTRCVAVVTSLRADIDAGDTRTCQGCGRGSVGDVFGARRVGRAGQLHRPPALRAGGAERSPRGCSAARR